MRNSTRMFRHAVSSRLVAPPLAGRDPSAVRGRGRSRVAPQAEPAPPANHFGRWTHRGNQVGSFEEDEV